MKIREIITEQTITPAEISEYLKKPNLAQEYRRVYGGQFNKSQIQQAMNNMVRTPGGRMISSVEQLYGSAAAQVAQAQKPAAAPAGNTGNTGKTATVGQDNTGGDNKNKSGATYSAVSGKVRRAANKVKSTVGAVSDFLGSQVRASGAK